LWKPQSDQISLPPDKSPPNAHEASILLKKSKDEFG